MNLDPGGRLGRLQERNPDALRLARLLCTAVRVEPELVRHARLRLLPHADVGAEADLWSSDLLGSASVLAFSFRADVAVALRLQLAEEAIEIRDAAITLVEGVHGQLHWSLRLEEAIHALEVRDGPDSNQQREQLLLAAVGELDRLSDGRERRALARWLLAAYARLTPTSQGSDEAGAAVLAAGFHLDGRIAVPDDGSEGLESDWMPWLLDRSISSRQTRVRISFTPANLMLEIADPNSPSGAGGAEISIPATDPPVIDISAGADRTIRRYQLAGTGPLIVPMVGDVAVLSSLDGARFTVRRPGSAVAGHDFGPRRAELRPCLARDDTVEDICARLDRGTSLITVGGPAGIGKSVVLNAVVDAMLPRATVLSHFCGVRPTWDEPESMAASLHSQLRLNRPDPAPESDHQTGRDRLRNALTVWGRDATGQEKDRRRLLVVVDGVPGDSPEEVAIAVQKLPMPDYPSDGVHFLLSTRQQGGVRNALGRAYGMHFVDLADQPTELVCHTMIQRDRGMLRLAFGITDQSHIDVGDGMRSTAEQDGVVANWLIEQVEANPGRLGRLLNWAGNQPPGSVTFDRIPVAFTRRLTDVWNRVDRLSGQIGVSLPMWLGWVAVALPGFTMPDWQRLFDETSLHSSAAPDPGALFDEIPEFVTTTRSPGNYPTTLAATNQSVLQAFGERFGSEAIRKAHADHSRRIQPTNVDQASDYQIHSAVVHYLGADDLQGAADLLLDLRFLARRFGLGGLVALAEDLDLTLRAVEGSRKSALQALRRAVDGVAEFVSVEPELFENLLPGKYVAQGGPAEYLPLPQAPQLLLEHTIDVGGTPCLWTFPAWDPLATVVDGAVMLATQGVVTEIRMGQQVNLLPGVEKPCFYAANSEYHAVADPDRVAIFDRAEQRNSPPNDKPTALIGFRDGFASGHADGTVVIHRPQDGEWHRNVIVGHSDRITAMIATGDSLITGSADSTIRIGNKDGTPILWYRGHRGPVEHLTMLPDGRVGSADATGLIRVWQAVDGKDLGMITGHRGPIAAMVANSSGLITAGSDGVIQRRSAASERVTFKTQGFRIVDAALDGSLDPHLLTAEPDATLRWWNPMSGQEVKEFRQPEVRGTIRQLITEPGGGVIVVHDAGMTSITPPSGNPNTEPSTWLGALDLGVTGKIAVLGVPDGLCRIDIGTMEILSTEHLDGNSRPVIVRDDPSSNGLITVGVDGRVRFGTEVIQDTRVRLLTGDYFPDSVAAVSLDGKLVVLTPSTETVVNTDHLVGGITAIEGRQFILVIGTRAGELSVLSRSQWEAHRLFDATVPAEVAGLTMAGTRRCVIGCADGSVHSWVFGQNPELLGSHRGSVTHVVAVPDANNADEDSEPSWLAVTSAKDGLLRLWDLDTGQFVGAVAVGLAVEAIAATRNCVVVRLSNGELWVLAVRPELSDRQAESPA